MQVFTSIAAIPDGFGPSVVTIGNFDGVHRGHQQVLQRTVDQARLLGVQAVVMTFDPHPAAIHRPDHVPQPICSLSERLDLIANTGIDACVVVPYSMEFAQQSPTDFVTRCLLKPLRMCAIVAGHDIRFGWQNAGDLDTLKQLSAEFGFDVIGVADVGHDGDQVPRWSSSLIREAIDAGDLQSASDMLGRAPHVDGTVVHGDHRGRELGFPTANLGGAVTGIIPQDGVYAGWLVLQGDAQRYPAAISVGTNPTFGENHRRVEVHVIDINPGRDDEYVGEFNIYGQDVRVEFVARIRGQVAFTSVDDLIAQMNDDVARVRTILAQCEHN